MKIKLNKEESKVIHKVTFALYWLYESENENPDWGITVKQFNKLLREKFIIEPESISYKEPKTE
tara:strand:- start:229 stop:420 length:192 start_codon:yes stop_codon:yes gene_type:complete